MSYHLAGFGDDPMPKYATGGKIPVMQACEPGKITTDDFSGCAVVPNPQPCPPDVTKDSHGILISYSGPPCLVGASQPTIGATLPIEISALNATSQNLICYGGGKVAWPKKIPFTEFIEIFKKNGPTPEMECTRGYFAEGMPCQEGFHSETVVKPNDYCLKNKPQSRTLIYVGIGAGALILAGIVYYCVRKT